MKGVRGTLREIKVIFYLNDKHNLLQYTLFEFDRYPTIDLQNQLVYHDVRYHKIDLIVYVVISMLV